MELVKAGGGVAVCSMCGDVGIAELLFLCIKCSLRPQHLYCSRSYPHVRGEASICNWCLHEQDSSTSSTATANSTVLDNPTACAKADKANDADAGANRNAPNRVAKSKAPAAPPRAGEGYIGQEALGEASGGHGTAFEYLLLIAAQSSLPHVIGESSDEIKEVNLQIASKIGTASPKMLNFLDNKAISDTDNIAKSGSTDQSRKLIGSFETQARNNRNDRERSMTGSCRELSMELQSAVKTKLEDEKDYEERACALGRNIPKRQRCSKGMIATALKCRKKGLQFIGPTRPNYRRYKLLADVVC